mgnify:CR=1 FL=1
MGESILVHVPQRHQRLGASLQGLLDRLGRDADLRSAIARLRASGLVEDARRVSLKRELEACAAIAAPKLCPTDPDFTADHQYGLHNSFNDADMDLPEAWAVSAVCTWLRAFCRVVASAILCFARLATALS